MTNEEYLKQLKKAQKNFLAQLREDPEKLKRFLRDVMGPPHVTLEGEEREQALTMLALMEPYEETNNQHSWSAFYNVGGIKYCATYFPEDKNAPIVDKYLEEDV